MSLLGEIRNYLIAQAIVRNPRVAGALPPLWLEPALGVPAPGDGAGVEIGPTLVAGAVRTGGFPSKPYESPWRKDIVDFRIRAKKAPDGVALGDQLRVAFDDKRAWTMAAMTVIESEEWRALDTLASDEFGFEFVTAYWFQTYA